MDTNPSNSRPSFESWLLDKEGSHNRTSHSQWLHNTMAELDKKMESILGVVEDGGDTFAETAEMYYHKRPQLIQMLLELHNSYRDLASKYGLLLTRSDSTLSRVGSGIGLEDVRSDFLSRGGHHHRFSCTTPLAGFGKPELEKVTQNPFDDDNNFIIYSGCDLDRAVKYSQDSKDDLEKVKWQQLKFDVSKLIEDNFSRQKELIKRNEEKRDSIKPVILDKRRLKDFLDSEQTMLPSRSSFSKLKKSLFGVFSC